MIRPKIKEIIKNIDKFEVDVGNFEQIGILDLDYKEVSLRVYSRGETFLTINCHDIYLSEEEKMLIINELRKRFKIGKTTAELQDGLLNSISFKEEG